MKAQTADYQFLSQTPSGTKIANLTLPHFI